jgi:hypothetical protein
MSPSLLADEDWHAAIRTDGAPTATLPHPRAHPLLSDWSEEDVFGWDWRSACPETLLHVGPEEDGLLKDACAAALKPFEFLHALEVADLSRGSIAVPADAPAAVEQAAGAGDDSLVRGSHGSSSGSSNTHQNPQQGPTQPEVGALQAHCSEEAYVQGSLQKVGCSSACA